MSMKVTLYGFDACSTCKQLRHLLEKFEVKHEYIDMVKTKTEVDTAPTLMVKFEGLSPELTAFLRAMRDVKKDG